MGSLRRRLAFTLIELMVVVAVMVTAIGIVTVGTHGLSARAAFGAAATQIGAVYRTGLVRATRSGRSHALKLAGRRCVLAEPVERDGEWGWRSITQVDLVDGVRITGVTIAGADQVDTDPTAPQQIMITPNDTSANHEVRLRNRAQMRACVVIDGYTGIERLEYADQEQR